MSKRFVMALVAVAAFVLPVMVQHSIAGAATGEASDERATAGAVTAESSSRSLCPPGLGKGFILWTYTKDGGGNVPLRCGYVDPKPNKPCNGFGWRHINCRHGWSLADDGNITNVLARPAHQDNDGDRHLWWRSNYCVLWSSQIWSTGGWKGIITAYIKTRPNC